MFEENVTIYSGVPPEEMPMQAEPQIAQEVLPEPIVEPPALMQPEPAANSLADRELSFAKAGDKLKEFIPKEDGRVVTIDGGSQVETEDEKQRRNLYELISSLRSKAVLTGRIEGVESSSGGDPRAIVYRGTYKILIPSFEIIDPPDDFRGMDPNEVMHYLITRRLGAEIDYVIMGIDQEAGIAVASRKEAMARKRRQFYFNKDYEGNTLLTEGGIAEARIMSVIRTGVFVELFGIEVYIPMNELSYSRMIDARDHFQPGNRVLVKIMELDTTDHDRIHVELSVKRTKPNPYDTLEEKFIVDNHYIGTVTNVNVGGVFVALDAGVDCLCTMPIRGIPMIGARVTVRLIRINQEERRLSGVIVHTSYFPR